MPDETISPAGTTPPPSNITAPVVSTAPVTPPVAAAKPLDVREARKKAKAGDTADADALKATSDADLAQIKAELPAPLPAEAKVELAKPKQLVFTGVLKYWHNVNRANRELGPRVTATTHTSSVHVDEDKLPTDPVEKVAFLARLWAPQIANLEKRFNGDIHFRLAYPAAECAAKLAATGSAV